MIRIALAEDQAFLSKTIEEKLSFFDEMVLKFTASNGKQLLDYLKDNRTIDLILMDIQMPGMDGIEATSIVKKYYPHIKIIMLTVFADEENIIKAIQAGANGYILKDVMAGELRRGIIEVMEGGAHMTPEIAFKALNLLRSTPILSKTQYESNKDYSLSKRESDVLSQLSTGLNYNEIGKNLFISPATVRKHIENIYRKLQVKNKIEALNKARSGGIL